MTSICVWRRSLPSQLVILLGDFEAFGRVFDLLSTTTSYSPKGWLNRVITGNNHSPDWHMQLPLDTASFAADPSAKVTENRKTGQIFAKTAKKSTRFVEKRSKTMNLRISITDATDLCKKIARKLYIFDDLGRSTAVAMVTLVIRHSSITAVMTFTLLCRSSSSTE